MTSKYNNNDKDLRLSLTSQNHDILGNHLAKTIKSDHQLPSPVLPKFVDARIQHQGAQNFTKRIQVEEPWITEALTDELLHCIVQIKEEEQQPPSSSSSSSSSFSLVYDRKYLNQAVRLIVNWSKIEETNLNHEFVFELSDIIANHDYGRRLVAELIDLANTAPSTLSYVLHDVLKHLFVMVSALWFYQSAAEEIEVRLMP